jgi:hypothetical protein
MYCKHVWAKLKFEIIRAGTGQMRLTYTWRVLSMLSARVFGNSPGWKDTAFQIVAPGEYYSVLVVCSNGSVFSGAEAPVQGVWSESEDSACTSNSPIALTLPLFGVGMNLTLADEGMGFTGSAAAFDGQPINISGRLISRKPELCQQAAASQESNKSPRVQLDFLQIGAHEGTSWNDPVREMYQRAGGTILHGEHKRQLRALLVEPLPCYFNKLQAAYEGAEGIRLEQVAICASAEHDKTMYYFNSSSEVGRLLFTDQNFTYVDQVGSFEYEHVRRSVSEAVEWFVNQHPEMRGDIAEAITDAVRQSHELRTADQPVSSVLIQQEVVPCMTLERLLQKHNVGSVDTMFVDTEGHDAAILLGYGFSGVRPKRVMFESKHTDGVATRGAVYQRLVAYLMQKGYVMIREDATDTVMGLLSESVLVWSGESLRP